ncbi:biliverdin-producing heme oxygenase [Paraclostridium sordellii]|uniref:biliverdin-producing heme oxygenase n=2 Tax=Paraclostridium sordellii TaxID=1505 RepID=UPI0002E3D72E|nr:biliverdin-producing heme oxygenase [Paeniclostridium sordellii]EPZ56326.1 heme oxygenase family protein [[Clostridium] sordellii VPI 9048] [Paeniclostridium sordellii VPI 9048]MDU2148320.1 biliverdin-producing heme oxygenase [Paeniclostridium sordellii]MDU4414370.1 biliverdin-producing heme oxygenase [Paeniclostridium sordellii]MDU6114648.1 biliverdin-producing heme oxygenase [Paeniclostridium sordellii]MDU6482184.1 biliverdin-producing heme oxygenase [Paeniclostridium sordellii]
MDMNFLKVIQQSTKKLHDMAENTGFIKRLVDGNATVESYGEYIYNLYFVYKAIEENLEKHKNDIVLKEFITPEVFRAESLLKDSKFLLGYELDSVEICDSTRVFVDRLEEISQINPKLLVAHAYTRYLADLFGGRTIFKIIKDNYDIHNDGLNYYMFDEIPDLKAFVMDYHRKLDLIDLNDDEKVKFLNEISLSYVFNISISNELEYMKF